MKTTHKTWQEAKLEALLTFARDISAQGYETRIAACGTHGFFTDGKRVVSFQVDDLIGNISVSGNYAPSKQSGTGWRIADKASPDKAACYIAANAPRWANTAPNYTTPSQYLSVYGECCGYANPDAVIKKQKGGRHE